MKPLLLLGGACLMATASHAFTLSPPKATFRTTAPSSLSFSMTPLDEIISDSSLLQEEFCNDMTHALLDFTSLWGNAATRVRLAAVLGRLFVIGQDVQHEVLPDEMAIQLGLLAVACHGLANTLVPKFKAQFCTPALMTSRDRRAFRCLFRPAGVSWTAFKELHSESMDWVHVEPGHVLLKDDDAAPQEDSVYWLYQGNVQVWNNETLSHDISGRQPVAGLGLFGEGRLANLNAKKTPKKATGLKAVAGENGATLLRMNTSKLEKMLRHDQELTHAIHRLAFMGMQDKLDALLVKEPQVMDMGDLVPATNTTI